MTRGEEIEQAAIKRFGILNCDAAENFIAGAEWADEHPVSYDGKAMLYVNNKSHENGYNEAVNKACKWLKNYAHIYVSETTGDLNEDELINDFCKAMKGE